nr:MAG TPA: hypothetical protein [Caudoviricetes sp.]
MALSTSYDGGVRRYKLLRNLRMGTNKFDWILQY